MRTRYSLQQLWYLYKEEGDKELLPKVIRAFRGIQKLPPSDPNSYEFIAGIHGMPFRGEGATDKEVWGGWCTHETVLFPTWHRAYLMRLEAALQTIPGCSDVSIPYWDETFVDPYDKEELKDLVPDILLMPEFELDGEKTNPLYSYKLQQAMSYQLPGGDSRYAKPEGYQTVRYPLSGLVGTEKDKADTEQHNAQYSDDTTRNEAFLYNLANWYTGQVNLDSSDNTPKADTTALYQRWQQCLAASDYHYFSNTESAKQSNRSEKQVVTSMESPHNGTHLAIGGFYQAGVYNASEIKAANGDMGANEMAGFDPIFWLHHAFCDYVFWRWQVMHRKTSPGGLSIQEGEPGTFLKEGMPGPDGETIPAGTELNMETPLYPFKNSYGSADDGSEWYCSHDLTHIENQLGYTYGPGSLDRFAYMRAKTLEIKTFKRVHNINRADYKGSFVVRTYATGPSGKKVEVGREPILSRWNVQGCVNCRNNLEVESDITIQPAVMDYLFDNKAPASGDQGLTYEVVIQTQTDGLLRHSPLDSSKMPMVDDYTNTSG